MGHHLDRPRLELACQKLAHAKMERDQLRQVMRWLSCEREHQGQGKPCWKATWEPEQRGDFGRIEFSGYWDHAGGNDDDGENHWLHWCRPCQLRERVRPAYRSAVVAYGNALRAFWATCRATGQRCGWVGASDRLTLTERNARHAAKGGK